MGGISIGWFSVKSEVDDDGAIAARIKEIVGPTSVGFPFACSPVKDDDGKCPLYYAVLRGHVPIHIDRPDRNARHQAMFMFVIEAENRPVLLAAPAVDQVSRPILVPDTMSAPKTAFGAIELVPGRAIHLDITKYFHGITGYPTGDPQAELPEAVIIQVPWEHKHNIGGALSEMKRIIRRDDRFADLITKPPPA